MATLYAVEPRDVIELSVPTDDPWALGDATALLMPQSRDTRIRIALALCNGAVFPADLRWGR